MWMKDLFYLKKAVNLKDPLDKGENVYDHNINSVNHLYPLHLTNEWIKREREKKKVSNTIDSLDPE